MDQLIFENIAHESRLKLTIPRNVSKQAILRGIKKSSPGFSHGLHGPMRVVVKRAVELHIPDR